MKYIAKTIITVMAMLPALAASAQDAGSTKYAIKASAERGLGNTLAIDHTVEGMTTSSSAWNYGVDFGLKIWGKNRNSIEAYLGLGYGFTNIKSSLPAMEYSYSAPAEADMDGDPYIRFCSIDGVYQKIRIQSLSVPIYVNYRYQFSKVFSLHALLGFKFGFNISTKLIDATATVDSYGVYPQYDNLMIDATYMNQFGTYNVGKNTSLPHANKMTSAFFGGIGAEFRVYGPLSIDVSCRYEGSMSDMIKPANADIVAFEAINAPVTYTVAEGQRVISLPSYFSESKISNFSAALSLLYRF